MFKGIHAVNLDAKGRMAIPARYRQRLLDDVNGQLVLTIDTEEPCLLLYPHLAWEAIEEKINQLPSFNKMTRRIQRLLVGHATELEMDANGRILLPQLLRDYAGLTKPVVFLGQGSKFELWDEQQWKKRRDHWLEEEGIDKDTVPEGLADLTL